jgi:uncharacterized protein (DUF2147 family)
MKIKYSLLIFLMILRFQTIAQTKADDIIGTWLTGGKEPAKIQVYKSGDRYYGKIIWLKYPEENGLPRMDANNPDKSKRSQKIIGLLILKDFKFDEDAWEGGKIYDPESGKTYSCNISLKNKDTLKVRGYVGISLIGRTEIWTRG